MEQRYIYLARHGETNSNKNGTIQNAHTELSEDGHVQAQRLAERASGLDFDHLLVSDMKRAQQTAGYVSDKTGMEIETIPDLREFCNPVRFDGLSRTDEEFQKSVNNRFKSFEDGDWDWKDSDEESFREFKARADRALDIIEHKEGNTFVVSHGHFMRLFIANILLEQKLTPEIWRLLTTKIQLSNTGITVFVKNLNEGVWRMRSCNDVSHFAE